MTQELKSLGAFFRFNSGFLTSLVEGFEERDWAFQGEAGGSPAIWILGHITLYRRVILRRLGQEIAEEPWEAEFKFGSKPDLAKNYPAARFFLDDFTASGETIERELNALTESQAEEPWGRKFPDGSETIRGGAHFLHFHETYHIGQLGYIRRLVGKPGLR